MVITFTLKLTTRHHPMSGKCVGCGCTEEHACEGGCSWVDADRLLCSTCLLSIAGHVDPAMSVNQARLSQVRLRARRPWGRP
jgi:hypothetical protein